MTTKILLLIAFCLAECVSVVAQNNPYKIDDRLYKQFVYIQNHRRDASVLAVVDSLYKEAVRYGDKKAQCAILCTPCQYATFINDEQKLKIASRRLREVSLKAGYSQYFIFGYNQEVVYLVNNQRFMEALQLAKTAEEDMDKHFKGEDMDAIYTMYGNIYSRTKNNLSALEYYKKAMAESVRNKPGQDKTDIYTKIAGTYRIMGQYDKALEVAEEGLANIKVKSTVSRRCALLREKCCALYKLGRIDEAEEVYNEIKSPKYAGFNNNLNEGEVYHYICIGEYDKAMAMIERMSNTSEIGKLKFKTTVAASKGDYAEAYRWQKQVYRVAEKENMRRKSQGLVSFYATVEKQELDKENATLNLEHNKLALHEAEMALATQRSKANAERMNAENMKLKLSNKELSLAKLREENQKQRLKASIDDISYRDIQSAQHRRRLKLLLVIGLLLVMLASVVAYIIIRMHTMKGLREQNEQLQVALDEAEESERVKMRFLRNMNHEIRTPLNAIVGFAQMLIHDEGKSFTPQQKEEYIDLVDENTQGLTDLINDILNISAIENNGDKLVKRRLFYLNELCRGVVANVKLRCRESVSVSYRSDVDDNYMVYNDASRIRNVLLKFLNNALKRTEQGKVLLTVNMTENQGMITFAVTDSGAAMTADMAAHAFDSYEELDDEAMATGMGLNICAYMAKVLGGSVKVDTGYAGLGSRFVFVIPVVEIPQD